MKAYIYKPSDIGRSDWPAGELRLDGFESVADPEAADVFVCPGPLLLFQGRDDLDRFPYMAGNEARHVFFDCSDYDTLYDRKHVMLVRCNLKQFMLDAHPNSISFAWPVEDFPECVEPPDDGFKFDVSCQAWSSTQTRIDAAESCRQTEGLTSDIAMYPDFTGYLHDRTTNEWTTEGLRRRVEFRRSMKESRIALCPESIPGVFPYRFFEAMAAARVPLLVGSDYVLPFDDEIPYDNFIIRCDRELAPSAGSFALEFVRSHSDAEILAMGLEARRYWLKFLNREDWPRTMAYAVHRKLKALGLTTEEAVLCESR